MNFFSAKPIRRIPNYPREVARSMQEMVGADGAALAANAPGVQGAALAAPNSTAGGGSSGSSVWPAVGAVVLAAGILSTLLGRK